MAWAKLWTDILGDEKLLRAARKGAKHLVLTPWLIAFAKKADDGGRLSVGGEPAEPADIAPKIPGVTAYSVLACMEALAAIPIEPPLTRDADGCYRFVNWAKRQGQPMSATREQVADRVRRHRAKRGGATTGNEGVTPLQDLAVTNGNALEVEGEGEQKENRTEGEGEEEEIARVRAAAAARETALLARFHDPDPVRRFLDRWPETRRWGYVGRFAAWLDGQKLPAGRTITPEHLADGLDEYTGPDSPDLVLRFVLRKERTLREGAQDQADAGPRRRVGRSFLEVE